MSRVVIIGGTGHVGTYLVPRLVCAGFEVINVSRGERAPYQPHGAWKSVRTVKLSRRSRGSGRRVRPENPRAQARHRHRHDLLHRSERAAELQHRQGGAHARLSAPRQLDRGRVQICELADRESDRAGRPRSGLTLD